MAFSAVDTPKHPTVSVIIPVYNTMPYLPQCLASISAQTLKDIEIICVDNGSTDGSYAYLQDYAKSHPNVIVIRHPEGRQGAARNVGLEIARGDYIGFVDSDDFVRDTMFEQMIDAAQKNNSEVVICNLELLYEAGNEMQYMLPHALLAAGTISSVTERPHLLRNLTICNKLYAADLIRTYSLRFPEGVFHEDQFFVITALLTAHRIATVPEALYNYRRQRPGSVNELRTDDTFSVFKVMEMVFAFISNNNLSPSLRLLVNEIATLKYMQLYQMTGHPFKGTFYKRMQYEIRIFPLPTPCHVLSVSERREASAIRLFNYQKYEFYLTLRQIYGQIRYQIIRRLNYHNQIRSYCS